ncbi:MAG: hypothetical protein AAF085_12780 [Planctomycetota bacterium]
MTKDPSIDLLVSRYLDNEISAEAFDQLCEQLANDADLRKRLLMLSALDFAVRHNAENQDRQNTLEAVLNEPEQASEEDAIFELYKTLEASRQSVDQGRRTRHALSLAGYVASKAVRDPRVITGLVAAVLSLGVLLYIALSSPGEAPEPYETVLDTTPQNEESIDAAELAVVATLTAERGAAWDRRPGQDLYAGQRFTLIQGIAEITTNRGAIAIVQAPATIEMLDNENAIQLHDGKLVGICETESSEGFLVRTPRMDITDLGTRFGVDVVSDIQTEAHVIDGEIAVLARTPNASLTTNAPVRLLAGEAARSSSAQQSVAKLTADMLRFAALLPITIELPGTGKGFPAGEPDTNWAIVEFEGQPIEPPHIPRVDNNANYQRQFVNEPGASQWLSWDHKPQRPEGRYTSYLFQTKVVLPDTIDPSSARIMLRQVADARLEAITVNGHRIKLRLPAPGVSKPWRSTEVIDQHLVAGENTLGFEVLNHWKENGNAGPVGLRVEWELQGYPAR